MIHPTEMNALTAVKVFRCLETWNARAVKIIDIQAQIVFQNVSVCDRNLGSVRYEDVLGTEKAEAAKAAGRTN